MKTETPVMPEMPKRDLSQINFQEQHWWKQQPWQEQFSNSAKTSIDVQKAAMIYEAMRRRPEVQQAWVEGKFLFGDNGWQYFTGWVVMNLPRSWPELDELTRRSVIEAMQSPWFVPPRGYSTFPDKSVPEKCKEAAIQPLRLPEPGEDPAAAMAFVEHARKFVDAGFEIFAVDNKTNQSVRYACDAIEAMPRSFRKADMDIERIAHLPADISDAERQVVEEQVRQGIFTTADLDELWRKYSKPATSLNSLWNKTEEVRPVVMHKRKRGNSTIEEKLFNFAAICHELEQIDSGLVPQGDFVQRLRL
jgi:hypothetical protein